METLPTPPGLATGQTSPQGGSGGAALGGPKKPMPAVMRWIRPRRSGQSWQENLQNPPERRKQMTVEQSTDAPSAPAPLSWKTIDWPSLRQEVRRLQMRIAKATQAGKHRKVQALQWLLTHSRSAKLLAVYRVTTNRGAKTPGVDNVLWRTDRQKLQAAFSLKRHGYRPRPLRRHYIPKPNGKLRPLSIPTLHDRAMQALYALALAPIFYGSRRPTRCVRGSEASRTMELTWKSQSGGALESGDRVKTKWTLVSIVNGNKP